MIADIGTGSGCLAISLAVNLPDAHIIATDISNEALAVAQSNAERHSVAERIELRRGDLLHPLDALVDVIAANLPYVAERDGESLAPEIRGYEPQAALFAGPDGLKLLRRLIAEAPSHLRSGGAVFLEFGPGQADALRRIALSAFGAAKVSIERDLSGLERVLVVQT
jgi:release factor glutamine methyltransferase